MKNVLKCDKSCRLYAVDGATFRAFSYIYNTAIVEHINERASSAAYCTFKVTKLKQPSIIGADNFEFTTSWLSRIDYAHSGKANSLYFDGERTTWERIIRIKDVMMITPYTSFISINNFCLSVIGKSVDFS